jgi:hypothetical protein
VAYAGWRLRASILPTERGVLRSCCTDQATGKLKFEQEIREDLEIYSRA